MPEATHFLVTDSEDRSVLAWFPKTTRFAAGTLDLATWTEQDRADARAIAEALQ